MWLYNITWNKVMSGADTPAFPMAVKEKFHQLFLFTYFQDADFGWWF